VLKNGNLLTKNILSLLLSEIKKYLTSLSVGFWGERILKISLDILVKYLNDEIVYDLEGDNQTFQEIKHQIITLDGLAQLLNSSLVEGGAEVPEGHYAEENMKDTVVPNRNKIFSSIIQAVALSISNKKEAECVIALGVHSGDHSIYPDCTEAFRNADEYAFKIGNWDSELVNYYTPYMEGNKFTILDSGMWHSLARSFHL
jgi:7-cyano-7-deazaguanine synthase